MYIYDSRISGFQHALGDASLGSPHWQGLGHGQFGENPLPLPTVSAFRFRNTGTTDPENCCAVCTTGTPQTNGRLNLGVGLRGNGAMALRAANGMELSFTLAGHRTGIEYDILRTRRNSVWQRVGGVWTRLGGYDPMGTGDDTFHTDECLRVSRSNRIFVEDRPGWVGITLPAPSTQQFGVPGGLVANPTATELVLRMSAAEWVSARSKAEGIPWTPLVLPPFQNGARRPHIYWHTITWLIRSPAGNPAGVWVLGPRSRIQLGSLSARVINSAPV